MMKTVDMMRDMAQTLLGSEWYEAMNVMPTKDRHVTFGVAYQQYRLNLMEGARAMISVDFFNFDFGKVPPRVSARIEELRAQKNLREWKPVMLDEWLDLWVEVAHAQKGDKA